MIIPVAVYQNDNDITQHKIKKWYIDHVKFRIGIFLNEYISNHHLKEMY